MSKVFPEEDTLSSFIQDALPSKPEYDLPLWNKYTKGMLGGQIAKKSEKLLRDRFQQQSQKLFPPEKSLTEKQFVEDFRKTSIDGMKPVAKIMGCIGCCCFPCKTKAVTINANEFIGKRECALKADYVYDNTALSLIISRPSSACCGLCPKRKRTLPMLVEIPPIGMDGDHDVWMWQGKMLASMLDAVVVHVCVRPYPEFEDPARMLDVVAAVKWSVAKGSDFGADTSRLGLFGSSASTTVITTTALELAARGESALVKSVFIETPTIFPDNMLGPYDGMSAFQHFINSRVLKAQYMWMAGGEGNKADWQARFDRKDVSLHCLHAPAELLQKVARHVIISSEFDDFRWQTDEYAAKLHKAGVLADYVLYPGGVHMTTPMQQSGILTEAVARYL